MGVFNAVAVSLADTLWRKPTGFGAARLREAALVIGGIAVLTVSAKTQLPMIPVPMTMQSAAVLLLAAAYGLRLGLATVLAYLLLGALGAPVFAGAAAGLAYFAGPTGGFLLGFALAAAVVGGLCERGWSRGGRLLLSLGAGTAIPFMTGAAWLAVLSDGQTALAVGVMPFLPGAVLKLALVFSLLTAARRAAS
jgi:biotin transport system substrate-specific component